MSAPEIIIDQGDYPTGDSLEAFEQWWAKAEPREAARWLVNDFPAVAEKIVYCKCTVADHPEYVQVEFITGGWSGAEDLLGALIGCELLRSMFYALWRKGGIHVFEIPRSLLAEPEA